MSRLAHTGADADPRLRNVVLLGLSVAGLTLCITLVFLGMRSVMDIGGACADGGPFVPVQPCPDGAPAAMILGIFGLFLFGGLTFGFGAAVGGAWSGLGILAWTGLFASLGWNFLEYGIISPPEGETVVWGWLIPGVMFEVMAFAPLVLGGGALAAMRGRGRASPPRARPGGGPPVTVLPGPGQPPSPVRSVTVNGRTLADPEARAALAEVAAALEAASREAQANTPVAAAVDDVRERLADASEAAGAEDAGPASTPAFQEGTQALLDRLERLADMRAQGLLDPDEYETAKELVLRELEARRA